MRARDLWEVEAPFKSDIPDQQEHASTECRKLIKNRVTVIAVVAIPHYMVA